MNIEYALVLLLSLVFMILLWIWKRHGSLRTALGWSFAFLIIGLVALLRAFDIINYFQLWSLYGILVTTNYAVVYLVVRFFYKDPGDTSKLSNDEVMRVTSDKVVHFIVASKDEDPEALRACIQSIIRSAEYAFQFGITTYITLVDDASNDTTATERIASDFRGDASLRVIFLPINQGKKGALVIGTLGQTKDWEEAYEKFAALHKRKPGREDCNELIRIMHEIGGYDFPDSDVICHTDSDSSVTEGFILAQVYAILNNPNVGACSGACDVNVTPKNKGNFWVMVQVAWYFTQFFIRKAAEGAFGGVFCVSGPVAAFRTEAIIPVLHSWARWMHRGKVFKGATDRTLTLLILMLGYKVTFSASARGWTNVPESYEQLRKQWVRWKTNFWHVLIPVAKFAWKVHPVVAFLTYSRLFLTVVGPFVMLDHMANAVNGNLLGVVIYGAGIMLMGGLMGIAYMFGAENPSIRFAMLRPVLSLFSSTSGSLMTLDALTKTLQGNFVWREPEKLKSQSAWRRIIFDRNLLIYAVAILIIILIAFLRSN